MGKLPPQSPTGIRRRDRVSRASLSPAVYNTASSSQSKLCSSPNKSQKKRTKSEEIIYLCILYEKEGKQAALDHLSFLEESGIDVSYYHVVLQNHIDSMGERQIKKHEAERKRASESRRKRATDKVARKQMLYSSVQLAWPNIAFVAKENYSAKQFTWAKQFLGLDKMPQAEPVTGNSATISESTNHVEAEDAFAQEDSK